MNLNLSEYVSGAIVITWLMIIQDIHNGKYQVHLRANSCKPVYSMGFLQKRTHISLNWLKDISSCRARWVVSTAKIAASNVVPIGRYRAHKCSWKTAYFAKNLKIAKCPKLSGLHFFDYYINKNEFQLCILVHHLLAHFSIYRLLVFVHV